MGFAGGIEPFILAASADQRGTIIVLVGNNRAQSLYRWYDCHIRAVLNPQGHQYGFDGGIIGTGTGVGCSRTAGAAHRDLVGLNATGRASSNVERVTRTQVVLDGLTAHNGLSDSIVVPADSAAARSAHTVSCGNLTPSNGGVSVR